MLFAPPQQIHKHSFGNTKTNNYWPCFILATRATVELSSYRVSSTHLSTISLKVLFTSSLIVFIWATEARVNFYYPMRSWADIFHFCLAFHLIERKRQLVQASQKCVPSCWDMLQPIVVHPQSALIREMSVDNRLCVSSSTTRGAVVVAASSDLNNKLNFISGTILSYK